MEENKQKHVYKVTLYYHTICEVMVDSETPLNRDEAIDKAYSCMDEHTEKELIENLQADGSPDVEGCNSEDYAFDSNGSLIKYGDYVMFMPEYGNRPIVAMVYYTDSNEVDVKYSNGCEYQVKPSDCTIVSL